MALTANKVINMQTDSNQLTSLPTHEHLYTLGMPSEHLNLTTLELDDVQKRKKTKTKYMNAVQIFDRPGLERSMVNPLTLPGGVVQSF